ncbi:hypothetical protein Tco_1519078 [Tanacetum coccineum]
MSTILALSYPSSNNQLETSLNPMHQVAMPERKTLSCVGNCLTGNDHIARSYTQLKKIQCLKQQMLLTQLQEVGIQLSKDQLVILADTEERINFGLGAFTVTTNALFQADKVEVYDSNCDDVPNTQPSFMANILSYGSDALAENSMKSSDPNPSCRPTKVEVSKELPKVSMVNTSLKKLKHHLVGFDVVVKERTTTTTITEGS